MKIKFNENGNKFIDDEIDIAGRIEYLAETKGVSINKMLSDCGIGKNLVYKMRLGQMPAADKIATIADYLGVSTDYLLGVTKDRYSLNKPADQNEKDGRIFHLGNDMGGRVSEYPPEAIAELNQYLDFLEHKHNIKR